MSLFIDQSGVPDGVFSDLFTISGSDLGLGDNPVAGDPTVNQVTYLETAGQPATADRLDNLVNGTPHGGEPAVPATPPIVATALQGGIDPHSGLDVTGNGFTYVDSTSGSAIIRVVYDVSDCNGQGIQVFDSGGNLISETRPVILYHELSHAFHQAIGQIPFPQTACPGNTTDEPAAEIDENVMRAELGLTARDPCNHGGQCGGGPTNSCFSGDTLITCADGEEKTIRAIREGDFVLGRDGRANRVVGIERPFLGNRKLFSLNGSAPFVTAEHPIMTRTGWKAIDPAATAAENPLLIVGRLAVRDRLLKLTGCAITAGVAGPDAIEPEFESMSLTSLTAHYADPKTPLYNLFLEGDHTYFANGFLVHNKCFIVSAATGSPESEEIIQLRLLRDRVEARSQLCGQLIDAIYREYFQFSPSIAFALEEDEIARKAVLWIVVRPLLAWYTLAGTLAFEQDNPQRVKKALQGVTKACPRYLRGSSIVASLDAILSNEPLGADTSPRLLAFVPKLRKAARSRFAVWAILDALRRVWATRKSVDLREQVAQWLADAPLDILTPPTNPERLESELQVLAKIFDFKPAARQQIGERLALAWPEAIGALKRSGLFSQEQKEEKE